ncbi:MAG: NFACT family protein [Clostridia bacterium]|nr:NFACT family protein [Clostridia bacterium]
MAQDAFSLYHVARELNTILKGAKINRVSQPDKDDVYLVTHSFTGNRTLVLSSNAENCRIAFTNEEKPNPKSAMGFCMLLRKHLLGSVIESVELVGFERIVKLTFAGRNDFKETVKKVLYAEIMGKYSNLILTENGIILGCQKNAPLDVATTRVTLSGAKYQLPKPQDKIELTDKNEAISRLSAFYGEDLAKFLFENVKGFAYTTAIEAAKRCQGFTSAEDLYDKLYGFIYNLEIKANVCGEGKLCDVYVTDYLSIGGEKTFYPTICDAYEDFYTNKDKNKAFALKKKLLTDKVQGLIKKLGKKLQGESEKLIACKDADMLRIKGELITANIYRLKEGMESCELENYYDEYKPIKITLDKQLSPSKNAQRYFKKYAKEKRTVEILLPQKAQTEKELSYLSAVMMFINQATEISEFKDLEEELIREGLLPKPKFKPKTVEESAYRVFEFDGYVIKCGKNNVQNDRLTQRAFKEDMWLHTKGFHSSHVIVETKGEAIPNRVIEIGAEICAYYSDAKQGSKVPVDYCFKKFVKKPPQAKPGSVIYTDYKTCYVNPDPHGELKK